MQPISKYRCVGVGDDVGFSGSIGTGDGVGVGNQGEVGVGVGVGA